MCESRAIPSILDRLQDCSLSRSDHRHSQAAFEVNLVNSCATVGANVVLGSAAAQLRSTCRRIRQQIQTGREVSHHCHGEHANRSGTTNVQCMPRR